MLTEERIARLKQVASNRIQDVVVLENIHDPHNAAAAFRNCDAYGIQTVHVIFEKEKMFNPEKLGKLTSASANKWLEIITWESSADCFTALKNEGFHIIATALHEKSESFDTYKLPDKKTAWVFGNEGFGISETAKTMADTLMFLPMYGFVESLNLSVTVGIVAHKIATDRKTANKCCFTDSESEALATKWIDRDEKERMRRHEK